MTFNIWNKEDIKSSGLGAIPSFSNLNLGYFFGFCMTFFQSVVNLFQRRWFYLLFYLVKGNVDLFGSSHTEVFLNFHSKFLKNTYAEIHFQ